MRTASIVRFVALGFLSVGIAQSASILEFDKWMQRIDKRMQRVQQRIESKEFEAAAIDAREIEELYRLTQTYFEKEDDVQAVKWSKEGRTAAAAIAEKIGGGKADATTELIQQMTRDCRTCHNELKPLR